ncbi:hypothetical protein FR801_25735 (plasmid) [Citrobacter freundii]|nr:hypothetical protein FR801_25735 [Citrobacter freundii]
MESLPYPATHTEAFCSTLSELCERITVKEKQLLAIENSGEEKDIEKLRTELSDLYRQFIFM